MGKKKKNKKGKKMIEYKYGHTNDSPILGASVSVTPNSSSPHQTYKGHGSSKGCDHDGKKPVTIGGYSVYPTASGQICTDLLDTADLVVSLNGNIPYNTYFGQKLTFIDAELPDRGGVPKNWLEFVNFIVSEIKSGKKIAFWCTGSHGRTGVLGASLIAVMEPEVEDPIQAFRDRHCKHAVESMAQMEAVFAIKGTPLPEKYKTVVIPSSYSGGWNTVTTFHQGPLPGPDGKSQDGKGNYYHHYGCTCGDCTKVIWVNKPCQCNNVACKWNGKPLTEIKTIPPTTNKYGYALNLKPESTTYAHHKDCPCGKCTDDAWKLDKPCMCVLDECCKIRVKWAKEQKNNVQLGPIKPPLVNPPTKDDNVVIIPVPAESDNGHEYWCACDECISSEVVHKDHIQDGFTDCWCRDCVVSWKNAQRAKWEASNPPKLEAPVFQLPKHDPSCLCHECWEEFGVAIVN